MCKSAFNHGNINLLRQRIRRNCRPAKAYSAKVYLVNIALDEVLGNQSITILLFSLQIH